MSRDAFSYDPQDAGETRDTSTRRSSRQQKSAPPDTRYTRTPAPEAPGRGDGSEVREQRPTRDERSDSPRPYYVRDRAYLLRDSEMNSLKEIGKFRVIPVSDLAKYAYGGNRERMEKDIRALARESLLRDKTLETSQKKTLRVVTLTKAGHRLLKKTNQVPDDQPIYYGLMKPREVKHDADLYRLYQKEAAVNGKIPVPDLRVEYENPELELRHVDLELATRDYRPRAMAEKASAGFALYGRSEDASRLRRVLDEQEITAGILTL